ncbi:hypothetical protein BDY21DRAFT_343685 [Lineolata rhizophorae]|uniref:NAD(P)-binding domain-containing protein n=1 Tax=Lineolata rhizophorae TaxID=578093 RepID=A0A6A6P0U2_9PEZI|nr:hypothetical protein BDY21DRAFT_343685 [Lineolata rhizophorae]
MPRHILVLGATGPSGIAFCRYALEEGHTLTVYVRTPTKIPSDIESHSSVSVIVGPLDDAEALRKAAGCGAKTVVSFLGPLVTIPPKFSGTPITDGYKLLYPMLVDAGFTRGLFLSTPSADDPSDKRGFYWRTAIFGIRTLGGSAYAEITGLHSFISSQPTAQLKWTLFRVPFLGSGEPKEVHAGYLGDAEEGGRLERKGMARWVLVEMEKEEWVGKAPVLTNKKL